VNFLTKTGRHRRRREASDGVSGKTTPSMKPGSAGLTKVMPRSKQRIVVLQVGTSIPPPREMTTSQGGAEKFAPPPRRVAGRQISRKTQWLLRSDGSRHLLINHGRMRQHRRVMIRMSRPTSGITGTRGSGDLDSSQVHPLFECASAHYGRLCRFTGNTHRQLSCHQWCSSAGIPVHGLTDSARGPKLRGLEMEIQTSGACNR
jgi:hypothetical protein